MEDSKTRAKYLVTNVKVNRYNSIWFEFMNGYDWQGKILKMNLLKYSGETCRDTSPQGKCNRWKRKGRCSKNWAKKKCRKTCGECKTRITFLFILILIMF